MFSRIDDRKHHAYPGLALAVISGARPVALRRVNYFEDFQFMGLFDPHPDHPMIEPQDLFVASSGMGNYEKFFMKHVNTGSWLIKAGDAVAAGQTVQFHRRTPCDSTGGQDQGHSAKAG